MPWLFYRTGWHWAWRSWRRVADQVARGLATLNEAGVSAGDRLAFRARQDPDSVATGLAIQAAGAVAMPLEDSAPSLNNTTRLCTAWVATQSEDESIPPETAPPPAAGADSLPSIVLPPALSALERTERRPLILDPSSHRVSGESLLAAAQSLERRLLEPAHSASEQTTIACVSPILAPETQLGLQAWTLLRGAALVQEPHPEAFLPALLWARPTFAAVSHSELEPLAAALATRKHRRHSRLRVVVAVDGSAQGGAESDTALDVERWNDLGVRIVALGEKPLAR